MSGVVEGCAHKQSKNINSEVLLSKGLFMEECLEVKDWILLCKVFPLRFIRRRSHKTSGFILRLHVKFNFEVKKRNQIKRKESAK